jgi:hypothetical protein
MLINFDTRNAFKRKTENMKDQKSKEDLILLLMYQLLCGVSVMQKNGIIHKLLLLLFIIIIIIIIYYYYLLLLLYVLIKET